MIVLWTLKDDAKNISFLSRIRKKRRIGIKLFFYDFLQRRPTCSCKVFPWMEILAAFVLALYGLSSWSSSKKLNLRASFWLEWENKTTFGKTFTWNIFWCFTRISEQTFGRKIRVDGNKSKVIFAKAKYLSDAKHAFKVCSKACRVIRF